MVCMDVNCVLLKHATIDMFSVSMRNDLRRVWGLPIVTHKALLYEISDMLQTSDEIRRRISDFIHTYLHHGSSLVEFIFSQACVTICSGLISNWE
jgi:hypothetical protein